MPTALIGKRKRKSAGFEKGHLGIKKVIRREDEAATVGIRGSWNPSQSAGDCRHWPGRKNRLQD